MRVVAVDDARLAGLAGDARHQGVVARVDAAARPADLDELLQGLSQPAFLLLLDGVTDPAQPRGLPARGRCHGRARGDRAEGPLGRADAGGREGRERRRGERAADPGHQPRAHDRGAEGRRHPGAGRGGRGRRRACSTRGWTARSPGCSGPKGQGLRRLTRERCDALVRIPMFGQVESLNVSVAAALCLYETRRQREASGER